jgi:predicted phage terminase large subunit-like protein
MDSAPFVPGWHIDAIAEHLEAITRGQIRNLLITIPPRHTKSTIVSVAWPSWEWIDHSQRRWLFASYAESLAIRDNVRSRRLIQSTWYQDNWGERFQFAGDQNEKRRVETDRGGHRIAVGTGGSATGEGGDRLVIDDPHNVGEIESALVRKGTLDWFDQVWSTRANDPKTTAKVIIMQRSHCDDLAGHVLEQGGWEHLSIPAEYEGDSRKTVIGWRDPRTEEGELAWPERFGPAEIAEAKRTLGSFAYAGQYQQRPVPAAGGVWKRHWFRFYRRVDRPPKFDMAAASWDCAFKDLRSSDYVCGQLWARKGADFYLLDQVHGRLDFPATLQAIRGLNARANCPVNAVLIEDKANGSAVLSVLKKEIPGMIAVNPEGGKEGRAAAVAPMIEAGNVLLPMAEEQPWVEDALLEFCTFPAAKHDDRVDAASQALLWLQNKGQNGLFELWRQEAEAIRADAARQAAGCPPAASELSDAQKRGTGWFDGPAQPPVNAKTKPAPVLVCPNCGNPNPALYAELFVCTCGARGSLDALGGAVGGVG